jgi:ferredoxin
MMSDDVYHRLAQRLDGMPNGYPATESGAELRLLAKIFEPEQAALAAVMRINHESADDIAARAEVDARAAQRTLRTMVRQGLIRVRRGDGELKFALMPFVVGVFEEQLPRLDVELAELFEAWLQESRGSTIYGPTPMQRVIPVQEAVPVDVEIFPFESAVSMLEGAKAWAVRNCICRVQKRLIGQGCDHPIENCLVFAPVEGVFDHSEVNRAISKEQALRLLRDTEEVGLVHTTGNYRDEHSYICNCCTCCCGILRGVAEFGVLSAVGHSDFQAVSDVEVCAGCGDCAERCQFGALSLPDGFCVVDVLRCVGCGQCIGVCPSDALQLVRRPEDERLSLPANYDEWMAQRAEKRRISLADIS